MTAKLLGGMYERAIELYDKRAELKRDAFGTALDVFRNTVLAMHNPPIDETDSLWQLLIDADLIGQYEWLDADGTEYFLAAARESADPAHQRVARLLKRIDVSKRSFHEDYCDGSNTNSRNWHLDQLKCVLSNIEVTAAMKKSVADLENDKAKWQRRDKKNKKRKHHHAEEDICKVIDRHTNVIVGLMGTSDELIRLIE